MIYRLTPVEKTEALEPGEYLVSFSEGGGVPLPHCYVRCSERTEIGDLTRGLDRALAGSDLADVEAELGVTIRQYAGRPKEGGD